MKKVDAFHVEDEVSAETSISNRLVLVVLINFSAEFSYLEVKYHLLTEQEETMVSQ